LREYTRGPYIYTFVGFTTFNRFILIDIFYHLFSHFSTVQNQSTQTQQSKTKEVKDSHIKSITRTKGIAFDIQLAKDTVLWYFSHAFRIHGYTLLLLFFLLTIFARNNFFSLYYFIFFLMGVVKGKWGTFRLSKFFLLGTIFVVIIQYLFRMSLPFNVVEVRVLIRINVDSSNIFFFQSLFLMCY
jgi:small-conductance mechanosensitive channel